MNVERHPLLGAVSGMLMGAGVAVMAIIYGLLRIDSLLPPAAIVAGFTAAGGVAAMVWPPANEAAFD